MKLVSGLVLASLLAWPAHAAARDPAPTLATDPQSGVTTLSGAHHVTGAAFSLIVTDWWLAGTIDGGRAQDVRLMVEVALPTYPLIDHATDAAGHKLDVAIIERGPSTRWTKKASERVAVLLPRDYAEKGRATGLSVTVSGKDRSFPITVPAGALARFLDSYAQAANGAGPTPRAPALAVAAPATPAKPAKATPQPAAAPDDDDPAITPLKDKRVRLPNGQFAPTAPAAPPPAPADAAAPDDGSQGGHGTWVDSLGLQFVATSSGALVLMTKPGSIAAAKGIESGDFIEKVDGVPIKTLDADQMAAKIGAPGVKVLHMIAVGDVKLR